MKRPSRSIGRHPGRKGLLDGAVGGVPSRLNGALWAGLRIGLLGGSFNPAHEGHRNIALFALRMLRLHQVWWLVSPQNPLKSSDDMASLPDRLASARAVARHPRLVVTSIESELGSPYTADTITRLTSLFPRTQFVWLMGADNLTRFHHWQRWRDIVQSVPIAVFDRPTYTHASLASPMASRYAACRRSTAGWRRLARLKPPAWAFLHTRLMPISATEIRARTRIQAQRRASG